MLGNGEANEDDLASLVFGDECYVFVVSDSALATCSRVLQGWCIYSQKKAEKLSSFIVMRFATARVMYSLFFMFIAAKKTSRICIAPSLFRIVSRGGGCVPISVQPTAVASRPIQTAAAASFAASFYITTHLVKGVFRSPHQLSRL